MDKNQPIVVVPVANGFIVQTGFPHPGTESSLDCQYVFESLKTLKEFLDDYFYATAHHEPSKMKGIYNDL